jgi:DNA ligase 1
MKAFADLYTAIDETTKTNEKIAALKNYFAGAPPEDAAWAIYFLSGRKPKSLVQMPKLWDWAVQEAAVPYWLFDDCFDAVGDLAETIALLLPDSTQSS